MISDYDDDTHFCLKCHTTILGLDNYVNHRKTGCTKTDVDTPKSPLPSQLLPPDESFGLKADDFFSSLELQSSSKKATTNSTSGKNFSGILTRSKTTAAIQATSTKEPSDVGQSKSGKNVWIGGHQLKELGHGDNQTRLIKAVANLERRKEEPSGKLEVYQESDDDSEEYSYEDEDDESSDEDAPPRNYTGGKWKPSSPIQWNQGRDADWNIPPPTHTGGKWKPIKIRSSPPIISKPKWKSQKEDYDVPPPNFTGSKWVQSKKQEYNQEIPPPTHTKGKWKPRNFDDDFPPPNHTKGKWKPREDTSPPTDTKGKWKPKNFEEIGDFPSDTKGKPRDDNFPSPTYTKGKWKPKNDQDESLIPPPSHTKGKWKLKNDQDDNTNRKPKQLNNEDNFPPPNHTKGKWKPKGDSKFADDEISIPASSSNIPKTDYTKIKWNQLEPNQTIKVINHDSPLRKSSGTVQYWCNPCNRRLASKIVYERHLKSEFHFRRTLQHRDFDDGAVLNMFQGTKRNETKPPEPIFSEESEIQNLDNKIKKRNRKKIFERCGVCQSKVNKDLIGKHLISHYHCRKGNIFTELAQSMVLENIYGIVLQSPFQCGVCEFYCNTFNYFIDHWLSKMHLTNEMKIKGYYLCSFCKFECDTTELMYKHLISEEHKDVVDVINRSVPIIIQKISPIFCLTCNAKFSLNIQLLNHCRQENHDDHNVKNQNCKNELICEECLRTFRNKIALQRHYHNVHDKRYFICSICNLKFDDENKAKQHRRSDEHLNKTGKRKPLQKTCEYCNKTLENFFSYKQHLKEDHPEHLPKCPHCGTVFNVSQELTVHLRTKSCKFEKKDKENPLKYSCKKCEFSSNSSSEFLFHEALHGEPLIIHSFESGDGSSETKKPVVQYKCSLCDKYFPKYSLLAHLRVHTKERPFVCSICKAAFVRKNNWKLHVNNHKNGSETKTKKKTIPGYRPYLCSTCGANFTTKAILAQHTQIHSGKPCKCPHEGCIFTARKLSEIKAHSLIHSDEKNFPCSQCSYRGKTKFQLKRHAMMHDNVRKFHCPKCSFKCRLTTHLKRHMRLHTGAKPFNCPYCKYRCNSMENLRKHILSTNKHPGKCIYVCKFCTSNGFQCNLAIEFKAHLIDQHPEKFLNLNEALTYIAGIYEMHNDNTYISDSDEAEGSAPQEENKLDKNVGLIFHDPIVAQLEVPGTSTSGPTNKSRSGIDDMLPTFVIPKDGIVEENQTDSWSLVGRYDVEESGELVPFQSEEGDTLFQEHFP